MYTQPTQPTTPKKRPALKMSTNPATNDKALDAKLRELKSSFMSDMAEAATTLLPIVVERILVEDDLDQQRKFLDIAVNTLGWKQAPPKDAFDNLPVFQFNFNGTGVTADVSVQAAQPLEMVQEVHDAIAEPTPTANSLPFRNADEDDPLGLGALDAALSRTDIKHRAYLAHSINQDVAE